MAADSNRGFDQETASGSSLNWHRISFQSGAVVNSSPEIIGMENYYGVNNGTGSLFFSGNSGMIGNSDPSVAQLVNPSASLLLDSVNNLKHDNENGVEWSAEEQYMLEEGLIKFADVPTIMRYVKIAATLGEKTVRDVALRCRWMMAFSYAIVIIHKPFTLIVELDVSSMRKRRKHEESHLGRKGGYRKEKLVEPSSKINPSSASAPNMAVHSFSMHQMDQNERIKWEVICRRASQLLEQNIQVFCEINQNLSSLKLQDNIALFYRTRENINNLSAIMKEMPGRMSQMQEVPVSIDQELADSVLPRTTQMTMLNMSRRVLPKQDLGYDGALPV